MEILVLVALALGFGVLFQRMFHEILGPSLLTGITTAVAYHLIGYIVDGKISSLVIISLIITTTIGFIVALAIGLAMRWSGKKPRART